MRIWGRREERARRDDNKEVAEGEAGNLRAWDRPHWAAGGDDAQILYFIFGDFPQPLTLPFSAYRTAGLPEGVELYAQKSRPGQVAALFGDWTGDSLRKDAPAVFEAVERAPTCLRMRGSIPDPSSLLYLRDVVGMVMALLENGGVAVLHSQALAWYSPSQWRDRFYAPDVPVPTHHISILWSADEGDGRLWIHTRGMRLFGRPDISIRDLAPVFRVGGIDLCNRLITLHAFGGRVSEGQSIRMAGLPEGLVCHTTGDYEDPDFNNVHIEIRRDG